VLETNLTLSFERELVLRRAQWKYPDDFWINHRLGINLIYRSDRIEEGIGYMRAAVAVRPESSHAMSNLGVGYHHLGDVDQAIACFRKALKLRPENWVALGNLGYSLSRKGLYDEATVAFERVIQIIKPDVATEAYAELSMIHSCRPDTHLRNPRLAAELAEKAIKLEPQASKHWTALGIARYRENQWQEARTAFEKSQQLAAHSSTGALRWDEAIDSFFLAMSCWQLGHKDQARQHYDRAVQRMGNQRFNETDVELLHRIRAEAEELLKIADEWKATVAADPRGAAEAFVELGGLRARQGNFRQAAADYAKAIELEPSSEFVSFQGGSLLAHLGQRDAFRKHCAAMLERFGDTQDRYVAERTAKLMSCVPTDFSGIDPQHIVALADRAVAAGAPLPYIEWCHLAKGMADYRAGQFDSAVLSIEKARTPHWPVRMVLADLYTAMAQFQLRDREASVKTLDGAVAMMMTLPQPGRNDFGEHFHDYLFCRLARREAEALILNPAREPTTSKDHNESADEVND
jgi:tetratricopeptide (TPR) repeat protein